jgi:hypothetical protein
LKDFLLDNFTLEWFLTIYYFFLTFSEDIFFV